jgi:hypothetical protein
MWRVDMGLVEWVMLMQEMEEDEEEHECTECMECLGLSTSDFC